ncbi:hypothetical protein KRIGEM_03444 [Komagataeibacter rhaeticus]|nr:hypothetical protein KRIGEM_03444 [Komagataeibacter rhaeticus]
MDFCPDMMGNEPHDTFSIGRIDPGARILHSACQTVDPEPSVRVEHHLGDGGIVEMTGNCGSQCGTQHAGSTGSRFGTRRNDGHGRPRRQASQARQ